MQQYTGTFELASRTAHLAIFKLGKKTQMLGKLISTYAVIHEPSGQAYVGSTADFGSRWYFHVYRLQCHIHKNVELQALFDADGIDAFSIQILSNYDTTADLLLHEEEDGERCFAADKLLNRRLGSKWINNHHPLNCQSRFPNRPATRNPGVLKKARWFDNTVRGVSR